MSWTHCDTCGQPWQGHMTACAPSVADSNQFKITGLASAKSYLQSDRDKLMARIAELEAERDSLRAKLLSAPEPWLDTKKIMVSDGTRDVTLHGEKYVNWYAANVAPLREGK